MTQPKPGSKAWLEQLQHALSAQPGGTPIDERILDFTRDIHARYRGNYHLDVDEQLPLAVFKRLIERLEAVVTAAATPSLYARLRALPAETFGRTPLIEATRAALLDRLDRTLASTPGDPDARLRRGELRLDDRNSAAAAEDFAAVLGQDDHNWAARHGAIRALLADRRDADALPLLDDLLRRWPDDPFGLFSRAQLLVRHNYVLEALVDIERLASVGDEPDALLWAAQQLLFVGRAREAGAICRRLPPSAEVQLILGKALLDTGELTAAVEALENVLRHARGQESLQQIATARMNALTLLGHIHAQRGETQGALARYAEAMAIVGVTYELRRAVVKTAWDAHRGEPAPASQATSSDDELADRWIEPNMTARFVDGRPVEITSLAPILAPYLERLPWVDTVESLTLHTGGRDNREALVTLFRLALPWLRRIEIEAEYFGFESLFRLVQAPFFSRLDALLLTKCDLDAPSFELLAERIPAQLRELSIAQVSSRPAIPRPSKLASLLQRWVLPALETLTLADCELDAAEAMALTDARLPKLTTLDLAGNDLRGLDIARFLDSAMVQRLHGLHIGDTGVELELLLGILDRVNGRMNGLALEWIRAERSWSDDEVRAVMNHPGFGKLQEVDLGLSAVPDEAWLALLE